VTARPAAAPPPYAAVVFDCDSTLSTIEGIEDLAADRADEIQALTARAMEGELPLEDVYGARLELIRPSADQVARIGERYIETLLPHARELVAALQHLGKRVAIVSGGLLPPVRRLGAHLGIPAGEVDAVGVFFDPSGAYVGFDVDSPLARAGGKLEVLRALASQSAAPQSAAPQSAAPQSAAPQSAAPLSVALVGDGATDLEAAPACTRFIAFGGVVRRPAVFAGADVTCEARDLAALLPLLTTSDERAALAETQDHETLLRAARELAR
jgi:phosphoserine phosphatase